MNMDVLRERTFTFGSESGRLRIDYYREEKETHTHYSVMFRRYQGLGREAILVLYCVGAGETRRAAFEEVRKDIAKEVANKLKGARQSYFDTKNEPYKAVLKEIEEWDGADKSEKKKSRATSELLPRSDEPNKNIPFQEWVWADRSNLLPK